MLFAVSGARSDVEWKDVSLVPTAVNRGKQTDTGVFFWEVYGVSIPGV